MAYPESRPGLSRGERMISSSSEVVRSGCSVSEARPEVLIHDVSGNLHRLNLCFPRRAKRLQWHRIETLDRITPEVLDAATGKGVRKACIPASALKVCYDV